MVHNIPPLALIPLVILWFGIDESAKLFLVSLGVFFRVYINTFHGIRSVDRGLIEKGRTYGLSGWPLYREIILPGALPSILVGVRFSLGLICDAPMLPPHRTKRSPIQPKRENEGHSHNPKLA
jgi:sulfonate transport system permease protein